MGEETYKLSPVTKSQLSISSPVYRGALVPECPISGESFIFEPVKGQVQSFDSTSRARKKVNVKTTRYAHEGWAFSFLWCVWIGIWHSYGFQMGFKMCPVFIQGNSLWIAHSVPFPERPHSLLLRSVRLPRLKQCSKVNIATVLAPSPLTLSAVRTLRPFFWSVTHFHPSVQVQWLRSERFFEQPCGLLLTFLVLWQTGKWTGIWLITEFIVQFP